MVIPGRPRRQVYAACVNLAACHSRCFASAFLTPRTAAEGRLCPESILTGGGYGFRARATQVGYSRLGQSKRRSRVNPRSVARPGMTAERLTLVDRDVLGADCCQNSPAVLTQSGGRPPPA